MEERNSPIPQERKVSRRTLFKIGGAAGSIIGSGFLMRFLGGKLNTSPTPEPSSNVVEIPDKRKEQIENFRTAVTSYLNLSQNPDLQDLLSSDEAIDQLLIVEPPTDPTISRQRTTYRFQDPSNISGNLPAIYYERIVSKDTGQLTGEVLNATVDGSGRFLAQPSGGNIATNIPVGYLKLLPDKVFNEPIGKNQWRQLAPSRGVTAINTNFTDKGKRYNATLETSGGLHLSVDHTLPKPTPSQ